MSGSIGIRLDSLKARRLAGGWTYQVLAHRANVSEFLIKSLEDGGNCMPDEAQRLIDALAAPSPVVATSPANPSQCLLSLFHTFVQGDSVVLSGVLGSDPDINGTHVITSLSGAFTINLDFDASGGFPGTGGTVRLDGTSVGLSRL